MRLTEHFQLSEFEKSSTAKARGINNAIPSNLIPNIKKLCEQVLELLRQHVGKPVVLGSGYRCPTFNKAVGGVTNSQHMTGEAADIHIPNLTEARKWMEWIANELAFDQLILEHCKNKDGSISHWIHVSYSRKRNRQYVISSMWKK